MDVFTGVGDKPKRGNPNREIDYSCTECGRKVGRANLIAKRVAFRQIGMHGKDIKSRVVAWLCIVPQPDGTPSCRDKDEAWNMPERSGSPGMRGTRAESE